MPKQDDSDLYNELDGLYGKLDKLLGKRGPDALTRHHEDEADFPVLTEVVEAVPGRSHAATPSPAAAPALPKVQPKSAAQVSTAPVPSASGAVPQEVPPEVMAAVEARLFGLLARQQQEVDETVRRIIREELAKRGED